MYSKFPYNPRQFVPKAGWAPVWHYHRPCPGFVKKMNNFSSLTLALEAWFETPFQDLPEALGQRVEHDLFPLSWDSLSPSQRLIATLQWDYQKDPAMEEERQFWWDYYQRKESLGRQREEWASVAAPTAGDLAQKEARLKELRQEIARMEQLERQVRNDYYPKRPQNASGVHSSPTGPYIPYPKAFRRLSDRLDGVTPEEVAAWVYMGPEHGGLAAYLNPQELSPPPRFFYDLGAGDSFDYLSPLMACWFLEDQIANFAPIDRYLTGKALIERWKDKPGIQAEAFIKAKIKEYRLSDIHPIFGGTQAGSNDDNHFPPIDSGLFSLSEIEAIEAQDFATDQKDRKNGEGGSQGKQGTPEWHRELAQKASNARHSQPGGTRDKQRRIREIWATGKYSSRDQCAKQVCEALGMSPKAARNALIKTPDPKRPPRC